MKILTHSLLFLLLTCGTGCSGELFQISGRVSVAGNAPFTYVRIVDAQRHEYRLVGPQAERLRHDWQGREVLLSGRVVKPAVGPGMPAEFEVVRISSPH